MSRTKQNVIVYSSDNQEVATQLITGLTQAGFPVLPKEISEYSKTPLHQESESPDGAIILLVTDNFLKSRGCMHGALQALKDWATSGKLVPVVADGRQPKAGGGWENVPTTFDRVSNIIQYMNHWQDHYLELRKEKRHHEEDEKLEKELELTKAISTEVGEFLRYLRNLNWYTLEDFRFDGFKVLRKFYGEAIIADDATASTTAVAEPSPAKGRSQKSLAEIIQDSSEELMAENQELSKNKGSEEEENPPVDVSEIPGMDMLNEAARKDSASDEDEEDDEVNAILNEVLGEEDDEDGEEYSFLSDDPENAEELDLNSLFDEETESEDGTEEPEEDEVLLDLISDDEEGLVINADGKTHATPEEILEFAVDLFDEGNIEEGLDYLKKTVKLNPHDHTLRYYYAYSLARYGERWKAARKQLNTILEGDNEHPDAWFLLAEVAENQGEITDAKQCFEKVASLQPDYPEVFYRLGLLTIQHFPEQDAKAAGYFKKAIAHNPRNAEAHYLLGTLLNERLGDPESAIDYFKSTLLQDPTHAFANYDLALLYFRLGEKEVANDYYVRATTINPELKTPQNDAAFYVEKPAAEAPEPELTEEEESTATESVEQEMPAVDPEEAGEAPDPQNEAPSETKPAVLNKLEITETMAAVGATAAITDALDFVETTKPVEAPPAPKSVEEVITAPAPEPIPVNDKPIVLITGATAGIGKATAEVFAANGYQVIITGRRKDRLDAMKNDFKEKYNNNIQVLTFDVRDAEAVKMAMDDLPEAWRKIDILINNAGLSRGLSPIHEGDLEHWDTMIDTNIKGLLYLTRAVSPQMVERRSGHIINVASGAGKEVYPGGNVYCATKFAVDALTKSMRLDLYKHNVRVSQVAPGHVEETEFASVRFDGDTDRAAQVYENFQPLKSSDVAETIFFIATRPPHVNIQDVLMFGTQQAGSNFIDRSGR